MRVPNFLTLDRRVRAGQSARVPTSHHVTVRTEISDARTVPIAPRCSFYVVFLAVVMPARAADSVIVRSDERAVEISWPAVGDQTGVLRLDLRPGEPLIESLGIDDVVVIKNVDPVYFLTVGSRESPPDRPPSMSVFNVFFDSPAQRPSKRYLSTLKPTRAEISTHPGRATIRVGGLTIGPFAGALEFTVYTGAPLVHVEAVVHTDENNRAFLYDTGLATAAPDWSSSAWYLDDGRIRLSMIKTNDRDHELTVSHRTLAMGTNTGSVAVFPPPHQFFFPRDLTDNQATAWYGRSYRGLNDRAGFGIRQTETGGGSYVPWFNAPPGTDQRLGVFYLVTRDSPVAALGEVLKFTHGDRFPDLPGRVTFTSHWHMATAVAAMKEIAAGKGRTTPDLAGSRCSRI